MKEQKIVYIGGPDLILRLPIMKLLLSKGYNVHVVGSNKREKKKFKKEGIHYWHYSLNRKFRVFSDIRSFFQLYKILYQENFCLVHAFDTKPTILARIAARLAGVSVIIGTIPGLGSLFCEDNLLNRVLRKIYMLAQMLACRVSDLTIFQNADDRDFFINKKISNSSKVTIIKGSGVDTNKFSPKSIDSTVVRAIKKELNLDDRNLNVVMVSRLVKYKGIGEYLEAARILKKRYPNVNFFLIGSEDNTLATFPVEKMSRYLNTVRYLGFRSDIPEILFLSDIVVLPSYYREGIPRVLLEAAAMGEPIITTNVPGCKEVVDDGVNGYLIMPKSSRALCKAIEKLILNADLRERMGGFSRKKVIKEFSLDIVFKETLGFYRRLLKKSQNRSLGYGSEI